MAISKEVLPLPTGPVMPTSCPLVTFSEMSFKDGRSSVLLQKHKILLSTTFTRLVGGIQSSNRKQSWFVLSKALCPNGVRIKLSSSAKCLKGNYVFYVSLRPLNIREVLK